MPPKLTPEAMMDPALAGEPPAAAPAEEPDAAAAPAAQAETPADDGRIPVTARLTGFHHAYLAQRAAAHGETPERHLEGILRQFRAHFDRWRHGMDTAPTGPGMPAGTNRR